MSDEPQAIQQYIEQPVTPAVRNAMSVTFTNVRYTEAMALARQYMRDQRVKARLPRLKHAELEAEALKVLPDVQRNVIEAMHEVEQEIAAKPYRPTRRLAL